MKLQNVEPLVITESHAARLLSITLVDFRKARLNGRLSIKPLPITKGRQTLYYKAALIQWLERESGLSVESDDRDWDAIVKERLRK